MLSYPARVGATVAEKYVIERVIGKGGMGVVVAARHVELDQRVAIKFLLPEIAEHPTAAKRFRREARAAARLRGDHACRVLDVSSLENGIPYMVMEYLEGCDLSTELARRKRLPSSEAVDYMLQACDALAEAHASGIVHRDLKPSNLFLAMRADCSRKLKVLDFGVSKFLTDSDAGHMGLTHTASFIGSPLYMSPEQLASSKDVDARTDIWALGAVLYELIAGRSPFLADTVPQLVDVLLRTQPPSFDSLGVRAPDGLEQVVLLALAKQREQRYASVLDFARALAPFAPSRGSLSESRIGRLLRGFISSPALAQQPLSSSSSISRPTAGPQLGEEAQAAGGLSHHSSSESGAGARSVSGAVWLRQSRPAARRSRWLLPLLLLIPVLLLVGIGYRMRSAHRVEPRVLAPAAAPVVPATGDAAAVKTTTEAIIAAPIPPPPPASRTPEPTPESSPPVQAQPAQTAMQPAPPSPESLGDSVHRSALPAHTDSPLSARERARLPDATMSRGGRVSSSRPHVTDFGGRK